MDGAPDFAGCLRCTSPKGRVLEVAQDLSRACVMMGASLPMSSLRSSLTLSSKTWEAGKC